MRTTIPASPGAPAPEIATRVRVSPAADAVTMVLATWMLFGLFYDGWKHRSMDATTLESPFTFAHLLFYSGYAATTAWMLYQVVRAVRGGRAGLGAVPVGYGLGFVGAAIFGVGSVGDLTWHALLGVEVDIEALLSPTHIMLFLGAVLLLTSPLRAAWASPDPSRDAPSLVRFLPALVSMTLVSVVIQFMFMYLTAYEPWTLTEDSDRLMLSNDAGWLYAFIAGVFVTTTLFVGPLLLLARRWRLPFGTATVLLTCMGVALPALEGYETGSLLISSVLAGLTADVLYRYLRPVPARPWAVRAWAAAMPIAFWAVLLLVVALWWRVAWTVELWAGVGLMAGFVGLGLGVLVAPPAIPSRVLAPE